MRLAAVSAHDVPAIKRLLPHLRSRGPEPRGRLGGDRLSLIPIDPTSLLRPLYVSRTVANRPTLSSSVGTMS